ncbi:hypothetical protein BDZ94DRAFT_1244185 [Collybia nuda]|uniref:Small ribosomal subunit protein mS38 n=1 Tax=Collybia nuda TaxID=64659 RepID=A0A9P6CR66_9AGAR|nr:hypothetical protein BDZ94DRAFT_1244185 [Collybia nuda]
MSAFARFLHPTPTARRAYSSFFSSKPGGGGRYFNSAKPPKVIPGGAAKNATNKVETSTESSAGGVQASAGGGGAGAANGGSKPNGLMNANGDQGAPASKASSASSSSSSSSTTKAPGPETDANPLTTGRSGHTHMHRQHPVVTPKDFKLHQFFSLHRPLLLLAQPSSILSSAAPDVDPTSVKPISSATSMTNHPWLLDEFAEASMDADAAAARQLTRALTINHAGATAAWENTLRQLGLDVTKDADRVGLQQQWDREWQEVLMDSTKRKRRKKMKKHKLKKRRKATRASRVKIGR